MARQESQVVFGFAPKKEARKAEKPLSAFSFWMLLLIFAGVASYLLFFSPQLEIENIVVSGNQNIASSDIAAAARTALDGKYKKYFSKSNFFFVQKNAISSALHDKFNRLEVVAIQKKFPNALILEVKERQPEIVWCSGGVCYFVDKEGLAYAGADSPGGTAGSSNFLTIIDDNAKPVDTGSTRIDQGFIEYLKNMDAILTDDLHFSLLDAYHTPALASGEIYAKIAAADSDGWTLKLDSSISPDETKKIIETVFDKDISQDDLKNLDYLDLSVKGKVYYKMK